MTVTTLINERLTVNELVARHPAALPVLNAFDVDSCCGGAESLAEAARSAQIPLDALLAGLEASVQRGAR